MVVGLGPTSGARTALGGADGGESTKEGTFRQALPADFGWTEYRGVGIWWNDFGVPFGWATLDAE